LLALPAALKAVLPAARQSRAADLLLLVKAVAWKLRMLLREVKVDQQVVLQVANHLLVLNREVPVDHLLVPSPMQEHV
jgi:hypothetical protein